MTAGTDASLTCMTSQPHLYDVIEEESVVTSPWDLAGSVLFAITVITTIGMIIVGSNSSTGE